MILFKFSRTRFMPWMAITSATLSLAVPAFAQQGDALPTRPANWPEFPPATTSTSIPPIRPGPIGTTANLPAFSGFGQGGNSPAISAPPPPTASLVIPQNNGDNGPTKVWNVAGPDGSMPAQSQPSLERSPKEFGNGWKKFVNQKMLAREQPAASLAPPQSIAAAPRPEWSWHGYDSYNQGGPNDITQDVQSTASAADMAPFMKFANRWRPSNIEINAGSMQSFAQSNPAAIQRNDSTTFSPTTAPTPATVFMPPSAPLTPIAAVVTTPTVTPAVAIPLDDTGRPSAIQQTNYRYSQAQAEPGKPRVIYAQSQAESPNSVPLSVRQRLTETCTGKCRNFAVELVSPMHLRVAFMVRDQVEADMLTNLLGGLTELAPYKVDFEVQIKQ